MSNDTPVLPGCHPFVDLIFMPALTAAGCLRTAVRCFCGHEDCDDHDVFRHEPMLKMYCGKAPESGIGLASQATLSRLENTVSWRALARMGVKMIATICDSFPRPPLRIVLDIDDTTDLTHDGQ